jgi:hypothetical protein
MADVDGEIAITISDNKDTGTLDEPIYTTIKRDVKAILKKCWFVLLPGKNKMLLHDCKCVILRHDASV